MNIIYHVITAAAIRGGVISDSIQSSRFDSKKDEEARLNFTYSIVMHANNVMSCTASRAHERRFTCVSGIESSDLNLSREILEISVTTGVRISIGRLRAQRKPSGRCEERTQIVREASTNFSAY